MNETSCRLAARSFRVRAMEMTALSGELDKLDEVMISSFHLLDVICREVSLSPTVGAQFSVELNSAPQLFAMRGPPRLIVVTRSHESEHRHLAQRV